MLKSKHGVQVHRFITKMATSFEASYCFDQYRHSLPSCCSDHRNDQFRLDNNVVKVNVVVNDNHNQLHLNCVNGFIYGFDDSDLSMSSGIDLDLFAPGRSIDHVLDVSSCELKNIPLEIHIPREVSPLHRKYIVDIKPFPSYNNYSCCVSVESESATSFHHQPGDISLDGLQYESNGNYHTLHGSQNCHEVKANIQEACERLKKRMLRSNETRSLLKRQRLSTFSDTSQTHRQF